MRADFLYQCNVFRTALQCQGLHEQLRGRHHHQGGATVDGSRRLLHFGRQQIAPSLYLQRIALQADAVMKDQTFAQLPRQQSDTGEDEVKHILEPLRMAWNSQPALQRGPPPCHPASASMPTLIPFHFASPPQAPPRGYPEIAWATKREYHLRLERN